MTLDQRKLKTPKGNIFFVESEPLALAVAAEWDSQKEHIVSSTMHLVGKKKSLDQERISYLIFLFSDSSLQHSNR